MILRKILSDLQVLPKIITAYFIIALIIFGLPETQAQEKLISYKAENVTLVKILSELTETHGIRFAYDAEAFGDKTGSFSVENQSVNNVIEQLATVFKVRFSLVEGTYIVLQGLPEAATVQTPEVPKRSVIQGYISDAVTSEPLAYCNIITSGQRGTITNHSGYFQFETVADKAELYITYLGYRRLDTVLVAGQPAPVQIKLRPFAIMIDEVKVMQLEKNMIEIGAYSEKIGFNPSQSASLPRITNDDLVNMLSLIPGVEHLPGSGGGLSVRGGDPSENLVLLDGIPLLNTGHLLGNISVLNANFIRQAFVSRGGFDASFGDRASGLIELTGKSGPLTHPTVDVSANLLNGNVVANIPVAEKFSLTAGWRKSYLQYWDNYLAQSVLEEIRIPATPDLNVDLYPSAMYDDLNLKAVLYPAKDQIVSVGFIQSKDFQQLDYEAGEKTMVYRNELAEAVNRGYSANWFWQRGKWNHRAAVGYNFQEQIRQSSSGSQTETGPGGPKKPRNPKANPNPNTANFNRNKFETDNDSNQVRELRADWKSELKTGVFTHQVGFGFVDNYFDYGFFAMRSLANEPVDSIGRADHQQIGHLFIQQYIEPVRQIRFRWGLRANYNQDLKQYYFQPRGGLEYIPSEQIRLYYQSGIYRQFLTRIPKVDLNGNVDMLWLLPDDSGNGPLRAMHHILGLKLERDGFLGNLEFYSRNTRGNQLLVAERYKKGNTDRVHYVPYFGDEANRGMDIFLQYRHGHFTHQAVWSMAISEDRLLAFNNNEYFPSLNDQRHRLNINEIYSHNGWLVSATWNYRTGQPRIVNITDGRFDFERLADFSQIDFGLVKTFRFGRITTSAGAFILNATNRLNVIEVSNLNFATETNNLKFQSHISSIGFTPVFFIRMQVL